MLSLSVEKGTMAERRQTEVRLMERPTTDVVPGKHLVVVRDVVVHGCVEEDDVLVRVEYISLDPAMRGWMSSRKSYLPPVPLGEAMRANAVGTVIESKSRRFRFGDKVVGLLGMREYALVKGKDLGFVTVPDGFSSRLALGLLGNNGLTAYFGLLDIGEPKAGETVVVSAAAGATGSIVAQIAKHVIGCRTIGIAGGPEKTAWLRDELRLDEVIDYKAESIHSALKRTCPSGIDVFFDNVGGETLDEVLRRLNKHARIVLCGAISTYNDAEPARGPASYGSLITTSSKMQGFIVFDYAKRYREGKESLSSWLHQGKIQFREDIIDGIDNAPGAFLRLFRGQNFGKLMVRVSDDIVDVSKLGYKL